MKSRRLRRMFFAPAVVCACWATAAQAQLVIINDNFDNGVNSSIYTQLTPATDIEWDTSSDPGNPKLLMRVFNTGDGLRINIPQDIPGNLSAKCLSVLQDIEPDTLMPRGFGWRHSIEMVGPDGELVEIAISGTRSFWNRCEYKFEVEGEEDVVTGFLNPVEEGHSAKLGCPKASDVRFDWSIDEDGTEYIEIEIVAGEFADQKDKFHRKKESPPELKHFPGGDQPPGPGEYRITGYKVTFVKEKEPGCSA